MILTHKHCFRSFIVMLLMVVLMMPIHVFAASTSGTHTPVTDLTVSVSGATDNSMTDGAITVTAKGSAGWFGYGKEAKTATITISNGKGKAANISFDWVATSVNQLTMDGTVHTGTSGSFNKTLDSGASFVITITTAENSTENKLVMSNFAIDEVQDSSQVTVQFNTGNSVSVDSEPVSSGVAVSVTSAGSTFTASSSNFVAWINATDNTILSETAEFVLKPTGDMTIKAVHGPNPCFRVSNKLYETLGDAITAAANGTTKTIILANSGTLPTGSYTIPSGVTMLIPYDAAGTLITDNMGDHLATSATTKTLFRQLTMATGTSITIASGGAICVGSQALRQMVGQVGPYGSIVMDSGSNITIQSGGTLYAWGYIFAGSNGAGAVTVNSGGTVYEDIMMMDYPGSASSTLDLFNDYGIFPLRAYTMRNVEVPMTFTSGAKEYVFYCLYGSTAGTHYDNVLLIGDGATAPFQLYEGTTLTKSYSSGKQYLTVNGSAGLNSFSITIKQGVGAISIPYTVSSTETTGFPLPSGFELNLTGGTLTLGDNVIMMEGSKVTVANGATINTNGKNLYVFDASDDVGAVSATDVHGTSYTLVNQDAVFDINGVLNVSGGFYTSANNASIISSEGTGKINLSAVSSKTSVTIKTSKANASSYDVNPAYLQNGDGTYVATGTASVGISYTYSGTGTNGKWISNAVAQNLSTSKQYPTLAAAISAASSGNCIQMLNDVTEDIDVGDKTIYLDLAGNTVNASRITVMDGAFYGMDSTGDAFGDPAGKIIGNVTVNPTTTYSLGEGMTTKHYVADTTTDTNGEIVTTFNRAGISVTGLQFIMQRSTSDVAYLTFEATFRGNSNVVEKLTDMGFAIDGTSTFYEDVQGNNLEADETCEVYYTKQIRNKSDVKKVCALLEIDGVTECLPSADKEISTLLADLSADTLRLSVTDGTMLGNFLAKTVTGS